MVLPTLTIACEVCAQAPAAFIEPMFSLGDIKAQRRDADPETHAKWFSEPPWSLTNPDAYLTEVCGNKGSNAADIDDYSLCVETAGRDFDLSFYRSIYPEAMSRIHKLESLGEKVGKGNQWTAATYASIRVYIPDTLPDFFKSRSHDLQREAQRKREDAAARRSEARERAEREERERQQRIAERRRKDRQQKIMICAAMNANLPNAYAHCERIAGAMESRDYQALDRAKQAIGEDVYRQEAQQRAENQRWRALYAEAQRGRQRQIEEQKAKIAASNAAQEQSYNAGTAVASSYAAQPTTPSSAIADSPSPSATARQGYEGFPEQQAFTINVPCPVYLEDLDEGGVHGGSREVTIFGDAPSDGGCQRGGAGNTGSGNSFSASSGSTDSGSTDSSPTGSGLGASMGDDTASDPESRQKKEKRLIESLTFCQPNPKREGRWWCNGAVQKLVLSDTLETSLDYAGCDAHRKWVDFEGGRLYYCTERPLDLDRDTGNLTSNRDISRWISIPPALLADRQPLSP